MPTMEEVVAQLNVLGEQNAALQRELQKVKEQQHAAAAERTPMPDTRHVGRTISEKNFKRVKQFA